MASLPSPFFATARPLVFAHRGGSQLGPENTMSAFDRAVAHGVDGIELDVRFSRDGVVVVHHDATLDRTTNLKGPVAAFTASELQRADAAYWFGVEEGYPLRGQECGVPTLEAVLCRHRDCRVIIEMKQDDAELAAAVVALIKRSGDLERICLGAFGSRVLHAARQMAPEVATSASREEVRWALYRSWGRWPVRRSAYRGYQVPEWAGSTRVVSPRFVRYAREAGLGVQVWTVNDPADAERLLSWGVDALITDRPDVMLALMRR
jgi:glycerophosphoryl diester phosphodiesterase